MNVAVAYTALYTWIVHTVIRPSCIKKQFDVVMRSVSQWRKQYFLFAGSPTSRAAAVAFGVGTGVGTAYSDSQHTVPTPSTFPP